MGREKRNLPAAVAGGPKERHRRAQRSQYDHTAPVPAGFVAKPALPKTTKHHSYFEFVENKDKKKKLEFQVKCDFLRAKVITALTTIYRSLPKRHPLLVSSLSLLATLN
jgi:hypothetical protein